MQEQLLGAMRFGLHATPHLLRVASIVTAIHTRYPPVVVTFVRSESEKILAALRERTLDMGYVFGPMPQATLTGIASVWSKKAREKPPAVPVFMFDRS